MNKSVLVFHLQEALEELQRIVREVTENPDYDEGNFRGHLSHLYLHINSAWNQRNISDEEFGAMTCEQFEEWRSFPRDLGIRMAKRKGPSSR